VENAPDQDPSLGEGFGDASARKEDKHAAERTSPEANTISRLQTRARDMPFVSLKQPRFTAYLMGRFERR